jgi:hypothetical protein
VIIPVIPEFIVKYRGKPQDYDQYQGVV